MKRKNVLKVMEADWDMRGKTNPTLFTNAYMKEYRDLNEYFDGGGGG